MIFIYSVTASVYVIQLENVTVVAALHDKYFL